MTSMTPERLKEVLRKHSLWLNDSTTGERAYLQGANLKYAYLQGAYLQGAYLQDAYLQDAYLQGANLQDANLKGAYLQGAYLQGADLQDANLRGADLQGANLQDAKLPPLAIVPEQGAFIGFKLTSEGAVLTLEILADAQRTNSTGRKCRASKVRVLAASLPGEVFTSIFAVNFKYHVGEIVEVADFDPDIRVECTRGLHFFITRAEAEAYCG